MRSGALVLVVAAVCGTGYLLGAGPVAWWLAVVLTPFGACQIIFGERRERRQRLVSRRRAHAYVDRLLDRERRAS